MGEILETILLLVIALPLIAILLVFGYFVFLALGWIFILLLIFGYPIEKMGWGYPLASICVYAATGLFFLFKPDLSGLPPALKFIANWIPAPFQRQPGGQVDLPNMGERMRSGLASPFVNMEKKFQARRYKKAADDLRADTEYQDAQADLHRAAQEYNRAKMRAEEAEEARRRK